MLSRIKANDNKDSDLDNVFPPGHIIRGKHPIGSQVLRRI